METSYFTLSHSYNRFSLVPGLRRVALALLGVATGCLALGGCASTADEDEDLRTPVRTEPLTGELSGSPFAPKSVLIVPNPKGGHALDVRDVEMTCEEAGGLGATLVDQRWVSVALPSWPVAPGATYEISDGESSEGTERTAGGLNRFNGTDYKQWRLRGRLEISAVSPSQVKLRLRATTTTEGRIEGEVTATICQ